VNQIFPRLTPPVAAGRASTTEQLDAAERLVIRSFRAWVKGIHENDHRPWNEAWNAFIQAYGTRQGKLALTWFVRMINLLREHSDRTIGYHQPGCPCLGDDERAFVGVIAACRAGNALEARDLASFLIGADGVGDLLGAAGQLALVLDWSVSDPSLREQLADFDLSSMSPVSLALN